MRPVWGLIIAIAAVYADSGIATAAEAWPNRSLRSSLITSQVRATELAEAPLLPDRRGTTNQRSPRRSRDSSRDRETFKYRLVVQGSSDSLLRQVRQIVPDAFRTTVSGRRVIQAGLFVEQDEAEAMAERFTQLEAETLVLALDQPISQPLMRIPGTRPPVTPVTNARGQTRGQTKDYHYRLVVQGSSDSLLRQVRQIVPDAFRTTINGRRVVQAGLFVERGEAEVIQRQLAALDTPTSIFDINYGVAPRSSSASIARDGRTVVVVDPGHGGGDPGAVGIGGIHEADIVLDVAQQVASLLEKQGVQAVLTRQDDREVELEPRVDLADRLNADLFVSIHANSIDLSRPDVNGLETYYYDSGGALATSIHNSLVNATGMPDRGIRQARFYVLTETSMPAVLVEIGFVTGRDDAARLNSSTSRSQIAAAIVQGILRYLQ